MNIHNSVFHAALSSTRYCCVYQYDHFLRNVKMDVLDYPDKYLNRSVSEVAKEQFEEYYLYPLGEDVGYVQLESEL